MVSFIRGKIFEAGEDYVVIESSGMGYHVRMSSQSIAQVTNEKEEVVVYTKMLVSQDDISLVGFASPSERELFNLLTKVNGVGAKVGISILSSIPVGMLIEAIINHDVKTITQAQGVGKKSAERIILELKDKIGAELTEGVAMTGGEQAAVSVNHDAIDALLALGYTKQEVRQVLKSVDTATMSTEEIIRFALVKMARG